MFGLILVIFITHYNHLNKVLQIGGLLEAHIITLSSYVGDGIPLHDVHKDLADIHAVHEGEFLGTRKGVLYYQMYV